MRTTVLMLGLAITLLLGCTPTGDLGDPCRGNWDCRAGSCLKGMCWPSGEWNHDSTCGGDGCPSPWHCHLYERVDSYERYRCELDCTITRDAGPQCPSGMVCQGGDWGCQPE